MVKKIILAVFIILLSMSFAFALIPTLDVGPSFDPTSRCNGGFVKEKVFFADSDDMKIGDVCSSDARVTLYWCSDSSCKTKEEVETAYKVDGELPKFIGFEMGEYYMYDCYECIGEEETSCVETVPVCNCPMCPPREQCPECDKDLLRPIFWLAIVFGAFLLGVIVGFVVKKVVPMGKYNRKVCPRDGTPMRKMGNLKQGVKGGKRDVYICPKCKYKSMK